MPLLLLCALLVAVQGSPAPAQPEARCRGQVATIVGTNGADRLKGTRGNDVIVSYGGNDRIKGLGGNDIICTGPGRDRVNSGAGNDWVDSGSGNDRVIAGAGRDRVNSGAGNDVVAGGGGNDVLKGGPGDDELAGGRGRDRLDGGAGFDSCGPASVPGREPGGVFGPARPARACEVEEISVRRQTVTFAGQEWSILGAVGSYEDPSTFGDPSREPRMTDQRRLFLQVRTTNRTSFDVYVRDSMLLLETPGRPTVSADRVYASAIRAGSSEDYLVAFEVAEGAALGTSSLVLGSVAVEQVRIPLGASARAERYPLTGTIDTTPRTASFVYTFSNTVVQPLAAVWSLELDGLQPDGLSSSIESHRAPAGHRFLLATIRFIEDGVDIYSESVSSRYVRIEIDGVPRSVASRYSPGLDVGEARDITIAFAVPLEARSVTVLVGRVGGTVAEFPVVVPDLSR